MVTVWCTKIKTIQVTCHPFPCNQSHLYSQFLSPSITNSITAPCRTFQCCFSDWFPLSWPCFVSASVNQSGFPLTSLCLLLVWFRFFWFPVFGSILMLRITDSWGYFTGLPLHVDLSSGLHASCTTILYRKQAESFCATTGSCYLLWHFYLLPDLPASGECWRSGPCICIVMENTLNHSLFTVVSLCVYHM